MTKTAAPLADRLQARYLTLQKTVEARRALLAENVSLGASAESLAKVLNDLAEAEADALVTGRSAVVADDAASAGRSASNAVRDYALQVFTESPGDTWSGRTNDVRRAALDGQRTALAAILKEASK